MPGAGTSQTTPDASAHEPSLYQSRLVSQYKVTGTSDGNTSSTGTRPHVNTFQRKTVVVSTNSPQVRFLLSLVCRTKVLGPRPSSHRAHKQNVYTPIGNNKFICSLCFLCEWALRGDNRSSFTDTED